jgi:acyl carrier protein
MITEEIFLENLKAFFEEEDSHKLEFESEFLKLQTWDSLTQFSIIAYLEDDFGIELSLQQLSNYPTPKDLFEFVRDQPKK